MKHASVSPARRALTSLSRPSVGPCTPAFEVTPTHSLVHLGGEGVLLEPPQVLRHQPDGLHLTLVQLPTRLDQPDDSSADSTWSDAVEQVYNS